MRDLEDPDHHLGTEQEDTVSTRYSSAAADGAGRRFHFLELGSCHPADRRSRQDNRGRMLQMSE